MPGKPFQSSLIPYLDEITELRRKKPPVSYARIAEILRQKHGLVIQRGAIGKFVKVRSKGRKVYFFKEEPVTKSIPLITTKPTMLQTPKPAVAGKPKPTVKPQPDDGEFEMEFSENYSLTRLTPEQAEARIKQLEEMERQEDEVEKPNRFEMPFSETYNLHRVSPEEAAARLKKIEEKRNREEQKDSIQIETDRAFEYPNPLPVEVREDDILKRIQNIITKNGRFDYLSLRDVPVSKCFLTNWTNLDVIKTRKAVIIAPIPQLF